MDPQISQLLVRWSDGDRCALDQLMPMVYEELRRLSRNYLRRRPEQSVLQPTVLIHEAWVKLAERQHLTLNHRAQFYALVAKIMRDILVDHFRRSHAAKRGGSQMAVPLGSSDAIETDNSVDIIALDEALRRLAKIKERYVELIELRFFVGLTTQECAKVLSISPATIEREWNVARAWLRRELEG